LNFDTAFEFRIAMQDSRLRRPTDTLIFNIREIEIEMTDRGGKWKWKWDRCEGPRKAFPPRDWAILANLHAH